MKRPEPTPGFAIRINDDTQLGLAIVVAEDEEGQQYHPVAVASTINEARELAASDLRGRMRELERGGDPGICPYEYKVWAQGVGGEYLVAARILATSL